MDSADPEGSSAGQRAAQHRRVLEDINQQVAATAAAASRRPKKVGLPHVAILFTASVIEYIHSMS